MPAESVIAAPPPEVVAVASGPTILKIFQCTNLGGMEQVGYGLTRDLRHRHGYKFRVTTPRPFGEGKSFLQAVDPNCRDHAYRGRFGWRTFPAFRSTLRELAPANGGVWLTGTCACSLAAMRGLPGPKVLSHHYHHFDGPGSGWRWAAFYRAFGPGLDVITYPTDFTRREAMKIAPWLRPKAHVVRNGFPVHCSSEGERRLKQGQARKLLGLPDDAFIVGNAGWLIQRKRFDIFLQTARRIKDAIPTAYFEICGGGPLEGELRDLAARLELTDSVRFSGWALEMEPHYQAWDVCLFNSDRDTLGCTPLEAASHRCAVVASVRYGGLIEFIVGGRNGVLLQEHNPDALARSVAAVAEAPGLAEELRERAVETLREKFSQEEALSFYRSIFG
jgi:L-malate glycosyltransferase